MWICHECQGSNDSVDSHQPWTANWRCVWCGAGVVFQDGIPCLAPSLIGTMSGFDPSLFDRLVRFEETSFWFVNRARLITRLLAKYFPHARDLLEIGCGTGSVMLAIRKSMPQTHLTGSELHPSGLTYARRRLGEDITLLQMDARNIPAREQFDVVGAFDVIEHIAEEHVVLREIHAALKPNGGAIFSVPQHRWLWSPTDDAALHQRRYERGELERKLRATGFRILHSTSFNSLLLPLMVISRQVMLMRARQGAAIDPLSEFQIKSWLNRLLSLTLQLEVGIGATGLRWPVGGSRVIVAQKI